MQAFNYCVIAQQSPNLHKCEVRSPPQLGRVVRGRRDQQGGVRAELAAERVSEGGEIFEWSISSVFDSHWPNIGLTLF